MSPKTETHLNVSDGRVQNRQVGRLFLVRLERELLLELLEALLQMGPPILLQFVVHFPRTNAAERDKRTQHTIRHLVLYCTCWRHLQFKNDSTTNNQNPFTRNTFKNLWGYSTANIGLASCTTALF